MAPARRMTRSNREVYPIMFFFPFLIKGASSPLQMPANNMIRMLLWWRSFQFVGCYWPVYGQKKIGSLSFQLRLENWGRIHDFLLPNQVTFDITSVLGLDEKTVLQHFAAFFQIITILVLSGYTIPFLLIISCSFITIPFIAISTLSYFINIFI